MTSSHPARILVERYLRHSLGITAGILASVTAFWVEAEPYPQWWRSEPLGGPVCGPYGDFTVQARGSHSDIVVIEQVVGHGQLPGPISAEIVHTADYVMRPFACQDVLVRFKPNDVIIISHPGYGTDFYGFRQDGSVVIAHEEMSGALSIDPAGKNLNGTCAGREVGLLLVRLQLDEGAIPVRASMRSVSSDDYNSASRQAEQQHCHHGIRGHQTAAGAVVISVDPLPNRPVGFP